MGTFLTQYFKRVLSLKNPRTVSQALSVSQTFWYDNSQSISSQATEARRSYPQTISYQSRVAQKARNLKHINASLLEFTTQLQSRKESKIKKKVKQFATPRTIRKTKKQDFRNDKHGISRSENILFKDIPNIYTIVDNFGFDKSELEKHENLVTMSPLELKKKVHLLQTLDNDLKNLLPLFKLPLKTIEHTVVRKQENSQTFSARIDYLCKKLEVNKDELLEEMSFRPFLLYYPLVEIIKKTEYLLNAGIAPKDILRSSNVYKTTMHRIKSSIEKGQSLGLTLKPGMVNFTHVHWKEMEQKVKENGICSLECRKKTLCQIFKCNMDKMEYAFSKNRLLHSKHWNKLEDTMKLLRDAGYTIDDITHSDWLLCRGPKTLEKYIHLWRLSGLPRLPLGKLVMSEKRYVKYLETRMVDKKLSIEQKN